MTTRITPTYAINGLKQKEFPINNTTLPNTRRKIKSKTRSFKSHPVKRDLDNSMKDLKLSLRQECLQLASFLKQESFRPGYVR